MTAERVALAALACFLAEPACGGRRAGEPRLPAAAAVVVEERGIVMQSRWALQRSSDL